MEPLQITSNLPSILKNFNAVDILSLIHISNQFGYIIDSNIKRIRLYISFIRKYDEEINNILESLHELVDANEDADFVKQIHLIETFKGAGFLSAVSIMGEIGDFSAFSKPKQLFAYFGLDPAVKQSGKFEGTKVQMSKRGSAIARRVIHTLTLQMCIRDRYHPFLLVLYFPQETLSTQE